MARKTVRMDKEFRDYVKRMRKHGYLVFVDGAGNVSVTPMQRGAKRGHRGARGTCPRGC